MRTFNSGQEAKEYLISQIVFAARSEDTPLSETERKMMYFTETAWAPSDMWAVNEAFEKEYDTPSYEAKIARIAATARAHASATGELDSWTEAVRVLRREDQSLLVLLGGSKGPFDSWLKDRVKLAGFAILIALLIVAGIILFSSKR